MVYRTHFLLLCFLDYAIFYFICDCKTFAGVVTLLRGRDGRDGENGECHAKISDMPVSQILKIIIYT